MKSIVLKTKRLVLTPMLDEELADLIRVTVDSEMKKAYSEMLDGCLRDPENRIWYTAWKICLKKDKQNVIGDVCFKGPQQQGAVEIGYGLMLEYEGKGYMTEAAKAVIEWAFAQKDVYTVCAETEPDNTASQRVLEKLGFKPCGEGEEGPRF